MWLIEKWYRERKGKCHVYHTKEAYDKWWQHHLNDAIRHETGCKLPRGTCKLEGKNIVTGEILDQYPPVKNK